MLIRYGVSTGFASLGSVKNCMLASSAVFRRQQFLIRSIGGYSDHIEPRRMQDIRSMSGTAFEADAENVMREITPVLDPSKHKGQAGEPRKDALSFSRYYFFFLFHFPVLVWLPLYFNSIREDSCDWWVP